MQHDCVIKKHWLTPEIYSFKVPQYMLQALDLAKKVKKPQSSRRPSTSLQPEPRQLTPKYDNCDFPVSIDVSGAQQTTVSGDTTQFTKQNESKLSCPIPVVSERATQSCLAGPIKKHSFSLRLDAARK